MKLSRISLAILPLLSLCSVQAAVYNVVEVGEVPELKSTYASAINDAGDVVFNGAIKVTETPIGSGTQVTVFEYYNFPIRLEEIDFEDEDVQAFFTDEQLADVLNGICEKLINRHPHIYGDVIADTEEQVKQNWEQIKLKEGNKSVLAGVPSSLPALIKASRIQEKARGVGFDWDNKDQVWEKVEEELQEFKMEFNTVSNTAINNQKAEEEFGDLLFSLINYARFININPEDALEKTNKKFIKRFQYLESQAKTLGKPLQDMTLAEMDVFWNEAKKI